MGFQNVYSWNLRLWWYCQGRFPQRCLPSHLFSMTFFCSPWSRGCFQLPGGFSRVAPWIWTAEISCLRPKMECSWGTEERLGTETFVMAVILKVDICHWQEGPESKYKESPSPKYKVKLLITLSLSEVSPSPLPGWGMSNVTNIMECHKLWLTFVTNGESTSTDTLCA